MTILKTDNLTIETIKIDNRICTHGQYHLPKIDSLEYPRYIKSYGIKIETRYQYSTQLIHLLNYSKLFFENYLNGFVVSMLYDDKNYFLVITIDLEKIERCLSFSHDNSIPVIYKDFYEVKKGIIDAIKCYKASSPYITFQDTFENTLSEYGHIDDDFFLKG
jgi:hypothetical protein